MQGDIGAILRAKSENFYFSVFSTSWPIWRLVATEYMQETLDNIPSFSIQLSSSFSFLTSQQKIYTC